MDKYLIVGLGNIGDEYENTRHNTGFMVLDAFAKASNIHFDDKRYGFVAETSLKGRKVILLKPSTYMNLSGNAVRYWLNKENIEQSRLLVISDDVALPLGAFRLKAGGSNGGHNGFHILLVVLSEHPIYLHAAWKIVADTHSQASIVLSDELLNMSQTIMPAIRATGFQTEGTERQSHIVADNQQSALFDIFLIQPVTNGVTAQVHVGGRFK